MGVLNVTPDSFSGDGLAPAGRSEAEVVEAAVAQARAFVAAGADILDVGGESSRPVAVYGAHDAVDAETEMALVVPVVEALAASLDPQILISIDTTKGVGRPRGARRRGGHGQRRVGRSPGPGHRRGRGRGRRLPGR